MKAKATRWALAVMLALGATGGAGVTATVAQAQSASSAVTVSWANPGSAVAGYQPKRDTASKHYDDFKNLKVSVDQTRDLVDQTVTVDITGMPGQTQTVKTPGGAMFEFGTNFVQAMQCWGDPHAADFFKNCEWGAFEYESKSAPSVLIGAETGVGNANGRGTTYTKSYFSKPGELDVPFRAVDGKVYSSGATDSISRDAPILDVFNAANTNERTVGVDAKGSVSFEFETQSASSQPYLGCGNPSSATGDQCWLVVVPRGTHNSATRQYCSTDLTAFPAAQQGSPVNPNCDYWNNRVVVPLNFRNTSESCASGGNEIAVGGTELAQGAFTSWQKSLCRTKKEAFAFTSSADQLAREQLITGQANAVFTMRPVTKAYVSSSVAPESVAKAKIAYAPMAVASVGVAYVANSGGTTYTNLRLTPRLIAKLVTNSYGLVSGLGRTVSVGGVGMSTKVDPSVYELPASAWQSPVDALRHDPEFLKANPGVELTGSGTLVLVGPNASDAIAQLWRYLQADDKARAFLSGKADNVLDGDEGNAGMTINPYYLPKGYAAAKVPTMVLSNLKNAQGIVMPTLVPARDSKGNYTWTKVGQTDAEGKPLCLCDAPVDTLSQSDQTLMPRLLDTEQQPRYDMSQVVPYAAGYAAAASQVFGVNTGSKITWEPNASLPNGGTYRSDGQQRWTEAFISGFTTSSEAARLALPMAALQVPNQAKTFVSPQRTAMDAAVAARVSSTVSGFAMVPSADALPDDAYPMTGLVYLAVNRAAPQTQRRAYADLIDAATSTQGQTNGMSIGQLPEGYAPLPKALRQSAATVADSLRVADPSGSSSAPGAGSGSQPSGQPSTVAPPSSATQPSNAAAAPVSFPSQSITPTPDVTSDGPPTAVFGGVLVASVLGLAAGPFLLRRKRLGL